MEQQQVTTQNGPAGEWEAKAAAAGARAAELESKVGALEAELGEARSALGATERKHAIQRELSGAGALDLEVATLLAEAAVGGQAGADIPGAVAELKRRKPYLFRAAPRSGVMATAAGAAPTSLEEAAAAARDSGDRRALLRYLRLRRSQ